MTRHRGRGIASINYPIGMNLGGDPSQALVHSNPSGKFTVSLSSIDLGQGMKSVTRQICAETLGVPVEDVYVDTADSDTGPHCMGSFASRGTHRVGKLHHFIRVSLDRLRQRRHFERQHVRVRQSKHQAAGRLRLDRAIDESWIDEAREVIE